MNAQNRPRVAQVRHSDCSAVKNASQPWAAGAHNKHTPAVIRAFGRQDLAQTRRTQRRTSPAAIGGTSAVRSPVDRDLEQTSPSSRDFLVSPSAVGAGCRPGNIATVEGRPVAELTCAANSGHKSRRALRGATCPRQGSWLPPVSIDHVVVVSLLPACVADIRHFLGRMVLCPAL